MTTAGPAVKTVVAELQIEPGDDTWSAVRVRPLADGEAPVG
ncbi:hypothetical protein [Leifsonia poae]|nr:hypothetical protein [Leifsonia poae]